MYLILSWMKLHMRPHPGQPKSCLASPTRSSNLWLDSVCLRSSCNRHSKSALRVRNKIRTETTKAKGRKKKRRTRRRILKMTSKLSRKRRPVRLIFVRQGPMDLSDKYLERLRNHRVPYISLRSTHQKLVQQSQAHQARYLHLSPSSQNSTALLKLPRPPPNTTRPSNRANHNSNPPNLKTRQSSCRILSVLHLHTPRLTPLLQGCWSCLGHYKLDPSGRSIWIV